MVRHDSWLGRLATSARPRTPWWRVSVSPTMAKLLTAAGARRSADPDAMQINPGMPTRHRVRARNKRSPADPPRPDARRSVFITVVVAIGVTATAVAASGAISYDRPISSPPPISQPAPSEQPDQPWELLGNEGIAALFMQTVLIFLGTFFVLLGLAAIILLIVRHRRDTNDDPN